MSSGGGSSSGKINIADYLMSIHYGICMGPVDSIDQIYVQDKSVGMFAQSSNSTVLIAQKGLFGGNRKNGGVYGYVDCMFGGPTQLATEALASRLGRTPTTCPAFRGITSLFFHDGASSQGGNSNPWVTPRAGFLWGSNFPTIPAVDVQVTRYPVGPNGDKMAGPNGLANPAHIVYECFVNRQWGMGCPIGLIDIPSFQAAAARLASENFWLGMLWARSDTIQNFVGEVLDHIQASVGPDPTTGKWTIKLLRDDYDRDNLFVVHPGNASISNMQRKLWGETANEVSVTYTNPDNEEEESVTVHDDANIAAQGQVVTTTRNYYGVRDPSLASALALRDLRQSASPLLSVDVSMDRRAWRAKPGDVVELRWPEMGIGSCFMRVGDVDYGNIGDSRIKTSLLEDIFSYGNAIFTELWTPQPGDPAPVYPPPRPGTVTPPPIVEPLPPQPQPPEWTDPTEQPRALDHWRIDTAPYFMLAQLFGDSGMENYVYPSVAAFTLVSQNSNDTSSIGRYARTPDVTGNPTYNLQALLPNMGYATTTTAMEPGAVTTIPPLTNIVGKMRPAPGLFMLFFDPANPDVHEITAVEEIVSGSNNITLRRAAIDTLPLSWPVGTAVYVFDGSNTATFDPVLRADGEEVAYKFTPVTSAGSFDDGSAPEVTKEVNGRPHYPYRPANVTLAGQPWDVVSPTTDLVVAWSRRNRLTETGQLLRWNDADVTPETGQTTTIIGYNKDGVEVSRINGLTGTSYTMTTDDLDALGETGDTVSIKVISVRDGMESLTGMIRYINLTNFPGRAGYGKNYGLSYGKR